MAPRQPRDRSWIPGRDSYPRRTKTFEFLAARLDSKLPEGKEPTAIRKEDIQDGYPSVYWMEDLYERGYNTNTVRGIEKIVREEAQRHGFTCAVIRRGPHVKTNRHAANGTVLTAWNERTGTYTNVTTEDDPHITVYLGWSLDELCVCGHIYIAWDTKALFDMRVISGPEERKVIAEGRTACVSEYWTI